jgi:hypothetical protein
MGLIIFWVSIVIFTLKYTVRMGVLGVLSHKPGNFGMEYYRLSF